MTDQAIPRPHDPLWKNYETLSTKLGEFDKRLVKVEDTANEAHEIATEARGKVDGLAASQVQAQKDFTHAIEAQTVALRTFGDGLADVKSIGRWLLVLIVVLALGIGAMLALTLAAHG